MDRGQGRFQYLDGLRGIACLMVVAEHYFLSFQPQRPLVIYDNGGVAVAIFFLMSGFVLTDGFIATQSGMCRVILARALRLLVPTIAAVLVATCLYHVTQPLAHAAAIKANSGNLFGRTQPGGISTLPGDLLATIFGFSYSTSFHFLPAADAARSVDGPIWTISYELYGSVLVFIAARLYRFGKPWWLLFAAGCFYLFGLRELGLFIVGHIARLIYRADQPHKFDLTALLFGAFAVAEVNMLHIGLSQLRPGLESMLSGVFPHNSPMTGLMALAGIVIFGVVMYSATLQRVLTLPPALYLGRLSFSIYLIHWPVMLGVGCGLYLLIGSSLPAASWLVFVAGSAATIVLAALFERYLDRPAIVLSRRIKLVPRKQLVSIISPPCLHLSRCPETESY